MWLGDFYFGLHWQLGDFLGSAWLCHTLHTYCMGRALEKFSPSTFPLMYVCMYIWGSLTSHKKSPKCNVTRLKSHQQSKCEVTWWLLLWFTLATWWFLVTCLCIILSDTHMGVIDKSQKLTKVQWYQAEKSSTLKVRSDWVTFVMGFISVWPKNGRQHWVRAGATTPLVH